MPPNKALHATGGWRLGLQGAFTNVRALTPALFLAPPRSDKVEVPRRVNASIVGRTAVLRVNSSGIVARLTHDVKVPIRKAVLITLAFGCAAAFALWWFARDLSGVEYVLRAARLAVRNPQSDAQIAIDRHDFRLVGVMGLGLHVPGMPRYRDYEPDQVRVIEGTSDFYQTSAESWFNNIAWIYAESYNQVLIDADVLPAELKLQQPVCVETGTADVLEWGLAKGSYAGVSFNWMVDGVGCVADPRISTRKATCSDNGVVVSVVSRTECFQ